ncbi:MAG: hypothetical protein ABJA94_08630 [Rhodoglobus sp.]
MSAARDAIAEFVSGLDLKQMDGVLLAAEVRLLASAAGIDLAQVDDAILIAAWAHREQRRLARRDLPVTSYIEHPLRNAARVLRWGISSTPVVLACILHDTVEDHAVALASVLAPSRPVATEGDARTVVLEQYRHTFGSRTAELVFAMSNPLEVDDSSDIDAKHRAYRAHVVDAIADPELALCKLADLTDNALSLHHTGEDAGDARTARLARKYAPLLPILQSRILEADVRALMSDEGNRRAVAALDDGIARLASLVA